MSVVIGTLVEKCIVALPGVVARRRCPIRLVILVPPVTLVLPVCLAILVGVLRWVPVFRVVPHVVRPVRTSRVWCLERALP